MSIDLTPLVQAILALVVALITYKLIPWIKARTTAQQQENLEAVTSILVYAAEQLYATGRIANKLKYVEEQLTARGYKVDLAAIEAYVRELKIAEMKPPDAA